MKKSWKSETPASATTGISNTYCSSTFTLTSTSSTISSAYIFTSSLSGNVCSTAASTIHKSASVSSIAKPQFATGWQDVSFKSRNGGNKKRAGAVLSPKMVKKVATDKPAKISANRFQVLSEEKIWSWERHLRVTTTSHASRIPPSNVPQRKQDQNNS